MSDSILEVSMFALHLEARATVQTMLDAGEYDAGCAALMAVLREAAGGGALAARADRRGADSPIMAPVTVSTVDGLIAVLAAAGFATVRTVWHEPSTDAYLSEGRVLTVLHVANSFTVYRCDDELAGQRHIAHVPAGWYLVGLVGDVVPEPVGVTGVSDDLTADAGIGEVAERLTSWAVQTEGFGASRCEARCSGCGGCWAAEAGSWHFAGQDGAPDWWYDDATGFDGVTVGCPVCGTGRVGFAIS